MAMSISELARGAGVGVETVRFYQRKGLLFDPKPSQYAVRRGNRHYGPEEAQRLHFIRSAQEAGFTLGEIAELLELDRTNDRAKAREMAEKRIGELDRQIAGLSRARAKLTKLASECAGSDEGPCPIIASFE